MKKMCILGICAIVIVLLILVYWYGDWNYVVYNSYDDETSIEIFMENSKLGLEKLAESGVENTQNMIEDEETAIAIGSAILKEHEPDVYDRVKNDIKAFEYDGIWTVYNEVKVRKSLLETHSVHIGYCYVQFYKKNGEIIKIGITD